MNWRPSDWENPYLKAGKNLPDFTSKAILYSILRNAYEEGADAILKALRKMAIDPRADPAACISPYNIIGLAQYWRKEEFKLVLIPDETDNKKGEG